MLLYEIKVKIGPNCKNTMEKFYSLLFVSLKKIFFFILEVPKGFQFLIVIYNKGSAKSLFFENTKKKTIEYLLKKEFFFFDLKLQSLQIYTDGSKLNGAVGSGIFSEVYKVASSLQCFSGGNDGNTGCG